jgi:4,5-dihydroxyphthalate decarboxylase
MLRNALTATARSLPQSTHSATLAGIARRQENLGHDNARHHLDSSVLGLSSASNITGAYRMENVSIHMVTRNYDHVVPIIGGDVHPKRIELTLDRTSPIANFREDASFHAGEMSFSQYLRRLASGSEDIVGLPIFLMRGFRQRCFFVQRGSSIDSLTNLQGKRIGTNGWPDSGNTWSRALLRSEGVHLDQINWWVGTIDGVTDQSFGHRFAATDLPDGVHPVPPGQTLEAMLLNGDLDALMIPWPPKRFYEPDGAVVRLLPNYRQAEQAYARQVGFYPAHHIVGLRTDVLERHPWVAKSLFDAFEQSRQLAEERRWALSDTSPWLLNDLEQTVKILGPSWQSHGVESNQRMIQFFCEEMHAQGIIDTPVDPDTVFSNFERSMG